VGLTGSIADAKFSNSAIKLLAIICQ